ncbi:glycosyltransferase family 4 protein [Paludibaculum fermentans]|uniref:Glycosyltransferase family 4 protein n=1 Tax=Paludibaculum fermentans TaxID=1473598 RepID=A0A7S7NRZ0_PALFE|nr:glycosyltransferase family 4 protein [Paludibaculum fermentans]QOY88742.1 glycosyltransferase family 4 protein [Paludibaculum fermentans]
MPAPRVLHLDTGLTMRGGQYQVLQLLKGLKDGARLLAPEGSPLLEAARKLGVPAGPIDWRAVRAGSREADLIHCHDARSHTWAALRSRCPFVVSRRVAFPVKKGLPSWWKYRRAAHFLAISEAVKGTLLEAGVGPERISVVYDCTPIPERASDRTGGVVGIESDDPGKGGALLRQTGLEIQFSRDLAVDFATARVFVYVTDMEGLGSAALLAMAHGVPVVASNVGGLPEIVRHEETGLLVRNSAGEVAAAVRRILNEPGLADRLAAAGRALVESRFTMERMAADTLAVYRKVLN